MKVFDGCEVAPGLYVLSRTTKRESWLAKWKRERDWKKTVKEWERTQSAWRRVTSDD
jgi:hypothetical protein